MEPRLVEKMSKAIALLFGLEKSLGKDTSDIAKFLQAIGQMKDEIADIAYLNASDFAQVIAMAQDMNEPDTGQCSEKYFKYWTHGEVVSMLSNERNDYSSQFDITINSDQTLSAMHILSASDNGYVVIQDQDDTTDDALWIERSSVKHIELCDCQCLVLSKDLIPLAVSMALTTRWGNNGVSITKREACNVIDNPFISNKVKVEAGWIGKQDVELISYDITENALVFKIKNSSYNIKAPFEMVRSIQSSGTY